VPIVFIPWFGFSNHICVKYFPHVEQKSPWQDLSVMLDQMVLIIAPLGKNKHSVIIVEYILVFNIQQNLSQITM
jgi:hypothetical protein